jgi:hypothetical protein
MVLGADPGFGQAEGPVIAELWPLVSPLAAGGRGPFCSSGRVGSGQVGAVKALILFQAVIRLGAWG